MGLERFTKTGVVDILGGIDAARDHFVGLDMAPCNGARFEHNSYSRMVST